MRALRGRAFAGIMAAERANAMQASPVRSTKMLKRRTFIVEAPRFGAAAVEHPSCDLWAGGGGSLRIVAMEIDFSETINYTSRGIVASLMLFRCHASLPSRRASVVHSCEARDDDGNDGAKDRGVPLVDAFASVATRGQVMRGALLVAWAAVAVPVVGRTLDFPPESFNVVARRIYAEAQSAGRMGDGGGLGGTPLRVLEIGAGTRCKSIFDDRFRAGADVVAVDVDLPDAATLRDARAWAAERGVTFSFERGDATALSSFPDASFDVVVCSLTLCSVPSAEAAIGEVRRVLRPAGRFGFIEHVRVNKEDGRPLLGLSQVLLDPLQQALAHGCHLQRDTPTAVVDAFGGPSCVLRLQRMVNDEMWPVSQLAAGVVVRAS